MFVTFEDAARFDNNGNVVVAAAAARPKSPAGAGGSTNYNLRRPRQQQQQQQQASVIAPGFHNLMLPPSPRMPGSVEEQTDDYEDGMTSLCI
jgi:hypothetical protein